MFSTIISQSWSHTVHKCHSVHHLIRNRYKQLGLATSVSLALFVFILLSWTNGYEPDPQIINPDRPRLKSSGLHLLENKAFLSTDVTDENLASILPNGTTKDSFPPDFFQCFPNQLLKNLNSYEDLNRYDSCKRIVYNRVPKCGSRSVLKVIKTLSRQNNFRLISNARNENLNFFRDITKLIAFAQNFTQLEEPLVYSQHIHFINFTQLGIPPPVFINVIREPTERVISHYYYRRYGSANDPVELDTNQTLSQCVASGSECLPAHQLLPFFCGQTRHCRLPTRTSLQMAKRTLRSAYLVVGITEDIKAFLEVLETLVPSFFSNASHIFKELGTSLINTTKTVNKPEVDSQTRQAIKDLLPLEYEFYQYAKQRFYTIYQKVNTLKKDWKRRKRGTQDRRKEREGKRKARKKERNKSKKMALDQM